MAKRKKKKLKLNICSLLTLLSVITSAYLIYNILLLGPIEKIIRYVIVGTIVLLNIFIFNKNYSLINNKKKKKIGFFIFLMLIFIISNITISFFINKVYSSINSINKDTVSYSSSLIVLKDNGISKIKDLNNKKIGMINNNLSIDNYTIPKEIIDDENLDKNNKIIEYSDINKMLSDLYHKEIDAMFISSNYESMFSTTQEYSNISNQVISLIDKEKTVNKNNSDNLISNSKSLKEPFTILLMGVDSEKEGLAKNSNVHGDSLILITFNPTTMNATMLTIPRDSYVPIVCLKDRENKLTHAAWYGTNCMIDTIESFLDIEIDYYVKINFKGVVSLVNSLGGIDAEVPKKLCTDDSNRWKKVCINKGYQHLDGEGALVLCRNRYDLANGDLDRGQNQQVVLKAMLNKVKEINSITKITEILDTISNNLDTNLTTSQILSFYNIGKDIVTKTLISTDSDPINIEQLYLQGDGQMIYDQNLKMTLWNYILNENSINDVVNEMKINLEEKDPELIKEFSFSINSPYTPKVIGKGPYKSTTKYSLLPSLLGKSKSYVEDWAKENNVKVKYKTVTDNNSKYSNNQVIKQNYLARTRLDKIDVLEITILNKKVTKINCNDEDNLKNDKCLLTSFIGMTEDEVKNWFNNYEDYNKYNIKEVSSSNYKNAKKGTVVAQNYKVNTHLSKVKGLEISIVK